MGALSVLAAPCAGYGCAANVLLAPVGAIVGGIAGSAMAEPATIVEEAEAAIHTAFADLQIPDLLCDQVLHTARAETPHSLVPQEDVADMGTSCERSEGVAGPVDTVLQISIHGYGTKAAWRPNPPVFLFLDTDVRLSRAADGTVIYSRKVAWMSAGRRLTEWAVANKDPVREELRRGIQHLAERIVDVVFFVRSLP